MILKVFNFPSVDTMMSKQQIKVNSRLKGQAKVSNGLKRQVTVKNDPVFHIIIDNLLGEKNQDILSHIVSLRNHYDDATVGSYNLDKDFRTNVVCYIDALYWKDFRLVDGSKDWPRHKEFRADNSPLLRSVDNLFEDDMMRQVMASTPFPLCKFGSVNTWETQVSRYGDNGQFYTWHYDRIRDNRLISLLYFVSSSPRKFDGGELGITNGVQYNGELLGQAENIEIKPENDRLVIFNSRTVNCIKPTKSPEKFEDGMFCVNIWAGRAGPFDLDDQL